MPAISIAKTYLNGSTLFQADLDSSLDSITTFLNTTKIDSLNVQPGGLLGSNLANSTVTITQMGVASVGSAQLASSAVTNAAIAPATILASNITSSAIETRLISPSINLPVTAQVSSHNFITANVTSSPPTLSLIRGIATFTSPTTWSRSVGEGWSATGDSGSIVVTFDTAFTDTVTVTANIQNGGANNAVAIITSGASGFTANFSTLLSSYKIHFIAMGAT